jgi:hypothetical protein
MKLLTRLANLALSLCAALLIFALVGCNSDQHSTFPVSGVVKFEDGGNPMFGDIEFYNEAKQVNARGKLNRDGTFTLGTYAVDDGAVEGDHEVVIIQRTRNHLTARLEHEIDHDHGDLIDRKYYDYRDNDLIAIVESKDDNQIELVVKRLSKASQADAD